MAAAQQVFEALPEAERKAIQSDLIWASRYSGGSSGAFGALTFAGLQAFEAENKLGIDGILAPNERALLAKKAEEARRAQKFVVRTDAKSGVVIGVPEALFVKSEANPSGGMRWQSGDGKVTLDTRTYPADATLSALFEKATGASPTERKITYKLLRPDFYVVSGETPGGKFYIRVGSNPAGVLRGFSIGYDKALGAGIDRLVIAIANSFDPFPQPGASGPAKVGAGATPAVSAPPLAPAAPKARVLSGFILKPGVVVSAAGGLKACKAITIGPKGLVGKILSTDDASGLAVISAEGMAAPKPLALKPAISGAVSVLYQSESDGLVVAPGEIEATPTLRLSAALQPGAAGGLVFDGAGNLVGLVSADPGAKIRVAGVVPMARYAVAGVDDLLKLAGAEGSFVKEARNGHMTTGGLVSEMRNAPVVVHCAL